MLKFMHVQAQTETKVFTGCEAQIKQIFGGADFGFGTG